MWVCCAWMMKYVEKKLCHTLIPFAAEVCVLLFGTIEINKWWRMTKRIKPSIHNTCNALTVLRSNTCYVLLFAPFFSKEIGGRKKWWWNYKKIHCVCVQLERATIFGCSLGLHCVVTGQMKHGIIDDRIRIHHFFSLWFDDKQYINFPRCDTIFTYTVHTREQIQYLTDLSMYA